MIKSGSSNVRKFQFFEVINEPNNIIVQEKDEKENPSKEIKKPNSEKSTISLNNITILGPSI